jgi:hypothetical protein
MRSAVGTRYQSVPQHTRPRDTGLGNRVGDAELALALDTETQTNRAPARFANPHLTQMACLVPSCLRGSKKVPADD